MDEDGEVAAEIARYREALRSKADDEVAYSALVYVFGKEGGIQAAIEVLDAVVRRSPGDASAHRRLADALTEKGDLSRAVDEYRKALALNRDDDCSGALCRALAINYREQRALEPALAHNERARRFLSVGDVDGAIVEYREAIHLKPDFALAHTNLARALEAKGNRRSALEEARKAYLLSPDGPEVRAEYHRLLNRLPENPSLREIGKWAWARVGAFLLGRAGTA